MMLSFGALIGGILAYYYPRKVQKTFSALQEASDKWNERVVAAREEVIRDSEARFIRY